MGEFFAMGGYAGFVWSAYGLSALVLLVLSPLPLPALVLAKCLAHWVTTGLPLVLAAPVLGLLLSLPPESYWALIVGLLIGTPALSLIGAVGAALTVGLRRGGLLLSLLVLPLCIPTLIFGVGAASSAEIWDGNMMLLSAVTLVFLAISPVASAVALRLNMT